MSKFRFQLDGVVMDGRLPGQDLLDLALPDLEGKTVRLAVVEKRDAIKSAQHAKYRGYLWPKIIQVWRDAGNTTSADDIHEWAKEEIGNLVEEYVDLDGVVHTKIRSMADIDEEEARLFCLACEAWITEQGYQV